MRLKGKIQKSQRPANSKLQRLQSKKVVKRKSVKKYAIKFPQIRLSNGRRIYISVNDIPQIKERAKIIGHLELYDSRKKIEYQNDGWIIFSPNVLQIAQLLPEAFTPDQLEKILPKDYLHKND